MVGDNPFRPGPGERPPVMVGRQAHLDVFADALAAGRMAQGCAVVFAGRVLTGRTAVLDAGAEALAAAEWPTFRVALRPGGDDLAQSLASAFEERTGVPIPRPEMRRVLRGIIQLLEDEATPGVALLIDDIDFAPLDQAAELLGLVSQAMRNDLPVIAAVTSLPSFPDRLAAHGQTECQVMPVGVLAPDEVRAGVIGPALAAGIEFSPDALDALARRCRGIPAFVQMLAHHAAGAASDGQVTSQDVAAAALDAEHAAVETFFRPVHARLAAGERRFLRALRQAGDGSAFEAIRRHLGEFSRFDSAASPARTACDALLAAGVIFSTPDERLFFSVSGYGPFVDTVD